MPFSHILPLPRSMAGEAMTQVGGKPRFFFFSSLPLPDYDNGIAFESNNEATAPRPFPPSPFPYSDPERYVGRWGPVRHPVILLRC